MNDIYCFGLFSESKCYVCRFNCKQDCMDMAYNTSGLAEKPHQVKIVHEDKNKPQVFYGEKRNSKCPQCGEKVEKLELFRYSKEHKKVKYMCEDCGAKFSSSSKS